MSTITTQSPINTALLRKTLAHIEANPAEWRQGTWRCGTGMCFAGHAVTLDGGRWVTGPDDNDGDYLVAVDEDPPEQVSEFADGISVVAVHDRARRVLGLNFEQARRLFAGSNDLHRLILIVSELCAEAER